MTRLKRKSGGRRGFTLVELLVVIVIIGILASLVVGLSGTASRKMRESRTRAELVAIETAIGAYKSKFGHYPPDNPKDPALNSLYYELTGCLFNGKTFIDPNTGTVMKVQAIKEHFGVEGFVNTARTERELKKFYEPTAKTVRHISEEHGDSDAGEGHVKQLRGWPVGGAQHRQVRLVGRDRRGRRGAGHQQLAQGNLPPRAAFEILQKEKTQLT